MVAGGGVVVDAEKDKVFRRRFRKLAEAEMDVEWYRKAAIELENKRWSIGFPRERALPREISQLKATLPLVCNDFVKMRIMVMMCSSRFPCFFCFCASLICCSFWKKTRYP